MSSSLDSLGHSLGRMAFDISFTDKPTGHCAFVNPLGFGFGHIVN